MPPALFNKGIYDDSDCNFGICEICYDSLPETAQLDSKMSNKLNNVCDSGHLLTSVSEVKKEMCFSCEK